MLRLSGSLLVAASLMIAPAPVSASTALDFYVTLLQRGAAAVHAGQNAEAIQPLRIAAFGLVDSIDLYETAQIYLALAYENLARSEEARMAAGRVVMAERISPSFGKLRLPATVRADFQRVAAKLTAADRQFLERSPVPPEPAVATIPDPATSPEVVEETPAVPADTGMRVTATLTDAQRHLEAGRLAEASDLYRAVVQSTDPVDRATLLQAAEGLYRARDFMAAVDAFRLLGELRAGEEPYRYYLAVSLFETGDRPGARQMLAAALPYIKITSDVEKFRARVAATIE